MIYAQVGAIDAEDRWAPELNDIEDVERLDDATVEVGIAQFAAYSISAPETLPMPAVTLSA